MVERIMSKPERIEDCLRRCASIDPINCNECWYRGLRNCKENLLQDVMIHIENIKRTTAQPKWISVEDELPEVENENGTLQCTETVLAADKNGYFYTGFFRIYKYDKSIEFVGCDHDSLDTGDFDVTHWMPLPKPPKEDA